MTGGNQWFAWVFTFCAQRVAVITLPPRDNMPSLRLADLDKVLACDFQRSFNCFRSAAAKVGAVDAGRCGGDEFVGERFHRLAVKK